MNLVMVTLWSILVLQASVSGTQPLVQSGAACLMSILVLQASVSGTQPLVQSGAACLMSILLKASISGPQCQPLVYSRKKKEDSLL